MVALPAGNCQLTWLDKGESAFLQFMSQPGAGSVVVGIYVKR